MLVESQAVEVGQPRRLRQSLDRGDEAALLEAGDVRGGGDERDRIGIDSRGREDRHLAFVRGQDA